MINKVRGQVSGAFGTMATDVPFYTPPENLVGDTVAISAYAQAARRHAYIMRRAHIDGQVSFGFQGQQAEYGSTGDIPLFNF
jgi:hypothetical protein